MTPQEAGDGQGRTGMDPARHGMPFPNWHRWPRCGRLARMLERATEHNRPPSGYGLCGGMSYAALDCLYAGLQTPGGPEPPAFFSALWRYLVRRQVAAWWAVGEPWHSLRWTLASDRALAQRTLAREWPRLRAALERGEPTVLHLIRVHSLRVTDNHIVVATALEEDPIGRAARLTLYDPNHRGQPVYIDLRLGPIRDRLEAVQSTGEPLRGLFVIPYRHRAGRRPPCGASANTQEENQSA